MFPSKLDESFPVGQGELGSQTIGGNGAEGPGFE